MKADLTLIGFLPESLVEHQKLEFKELKLILDEALNLRPFFTPLIELMKEKNLILPDERVQIKDLF
jgi:hypothetical protein